MALKHLIKDRTSLSEEQSAEVEEVLGHLLKEDSLRGEVYESSRFMNGASESFSIVDVHNVLDALIESLEGSGD
jgi:hypothetical protein